MCPRSAGAAPRRSRGHRHRGALPAAGGLRLPVPRLSGSGGSRRAFSRRRAHSPPTHRGRGPQRRPSPRPPREAAPPAAGARRTAATVLPPGGQAPALQPGADPRPAAPRAPRRHPPLPATRLRGARARCRRARRCSRGGNAAVPRASCRRAKRRTATPPARAGFGRSGAPSLFGACAMPRATWRPAETPWRGGCGCARGCGE